MSARVDQLLAIAGAISRGEVPEYQHNECFTSGAFDLLLLNVDGAGAFELLTDVCRRFGSMDASGSDMRGYYLLLSLLVRQANTTEMPLGMPVIINAHSELSGDLKQLYRYGG
jgi:hypothetical protein